MTGLLRTESGVATPLLSGGYLCDFGDAFPTFTADRYHAKAVLNARVTAGDRRGRREDVGVWPPGWTPASGNP